MLQYRSLFIKTFVIVGAFSGIVAVKDHYVKKNIQKKCDCFLKRIGIDSCLNKTNIDHDKINVEDRIIYDHSHHKNIVINNNK